MDKPNRPASPYLIVFNMILADIVQNILNLVTIVPNFNNIGLMLIAFIMLILMLIVLGKVEANGVIALPIANFVAGAIIGLELKLKLKVRSFDDATVGRVLADIDFVR